MHDRLRNNLLIWWAGMVSRHPKAILVMCAIVAVASVGLSTASLRFQSDRNDLLSPSLPWNKYYIDYTDGFQVDDTIIVALEVPQAEGGREKAEEFVDTLVKNLEAREAIKSVWWGFEWNEANSDPILLRIAPNDPPDNEFESYLNRIRRYAPLLKARNFTQFIAAANKLGGNSSPFDPDAVSIGGERIREYLATQKIENGKVTGELLFVEIEGESVEGAIDPMAPTVEASRQALDEVRTQFPGINAGLTGLSVLESDESTVATFDSTLCSIAAATLITLLLIYAFGTWRAPFLAVIALGAGVALSFGYLTLAIGHLQLLSIVFTVILLGLGIDFGIHIVSHYELVRHKFPAGAEGFEQTLRDTLKTTGPGIITGAVTTAVAFSTTLFTDFTGIAETGHIAGVGVLICMMCMIAVLPALMRLFHFDLHQVRPFAKHKINLHALGVSDPPMRRPVITLILTVTLFAVALLGMLGTRFDNNLMNLYPRHLESLQWNDKIAEYSGLDIWYGVSVMPNPEFAENPAEAHRKLRERINAFRAKPTVRSVGGVARLYPADEAERKRKLEALKKELGPAALTPVKDPADLGPPKTGSSLILGPLENALGFKTVFKRIQPKLNDARRTLEAAFDTQREINPSDLPPQGQREMASPDGKLVQIKIYPKYDIWDLDNLEVFHNDLVDVDPEVTGSPRQIYESGKLMYSSYRIAGGFALVLVLIIVLFDFRNLVDALLCMLPVVLGFVAMFGIMYVVGEPINPANIIVLPLMFGIGVDAGVHIVHRYQQHPRHRPYGLTHGTGKGITLTSLTTMIGFATMMFARHRGIKSLGFVLAVGITMTLIGCLIVMPAVLRLRNRARAYRRYKAIKAASTSA